MNQVPPVYTELEALNIRAANHYDYSNPLSDPRYDFVNWPLVKIGDLHPQRGIESSVDGNTSCQSYTNAEQVWLKKYPDPIIPATPEPEMYDYMAAIKVMSDQMRYLVITVAALQTEIANLKAPLPV